MLKRPGLRSKRKIVRLILLFFIILSACAKKEAIKHSFQEPISGRITSELLLERIRIFNVATLSASIKVRMYHNSQSKGIFSGVLLYSHPHRMRIRIFGPLGVTAMETLFNKGTLQILIPPKDTLYIGTVPFEKLLPDGDTLHNSLTMLEENDDTYLLYVMAFHQERDLLLHAKYFFAKQDLSLKAFELYSERKKQVRIEIYKREDKAPSELAVHVRNASFHLELKEIEINSQLGDELFEPLKASQSLPLSSFILDFEPNQ